MLLLYFLNLVIVFISFLKHARFRDLRFRASNHSQFMCKPVCFLTGCVSLQAAVIFWVKARLEQVTLYAAVQAVSIGTMSVHHFLTYIL